MPADQPTIQSAILAAHNGDTVLVAPGTYNESIDFKSKAITVTSSAGPTKTILDGTGTSGTSVTFKSGETRAAVLSGFTIQKGGYTAQSVAGVSEAAPTSSRARRRS